MADDMPVSDVLVEAMEYLSKLGSNLRTRSENLKDKRIRRDKLKNAHAVQKAAQKVLLICELSKKSLENVETGVKKVLQLVDKSQASIGVGGNADKSSPGDKTSKPSSSEKYYKYFKYRSCKLKIRKKISVRHYMSVKVLARQLPKTMQDKYPVYYDCKLYRSRKRSELKDKELSKSTKRMSKEDSDSDKESSKKSRKDSKDELDVEETKKRKSTEESHSEEKIDDTSSKNKEDSERERQKIRERKISSEKSKNDDSKERQKECKKSLLEDSESDKESQDMEKSKSKEKSAEKRKSDDFDKLKKKEKDTKRDESDRTNFDIEKLKKERRTSTVIDSDSDDISEKSKEKKKSTIVDSDSEMEIKKKSKEKKKLAIVESDSENDTKKSNEYISEKTDKKTFEKGKSEKLSANQRNKRILSTDSDSSQKESKKEHNKTTEDKSEKLDSNKKERQKNPDKESKSKENERTSSSSRRSGSTENSHNSSQDKIKDTNSYDYENSKKKESEDNNEETNPNDNKNSKKKESEKKKDLINLSSDDENSGSKKEDKTEEKKENNSILPSKSIIKCVSLTKLLKPDILPLVIPEVKKQDEETNKDQVKQKKTVRYQDEEEFWAKKRAEVKAFKPKDFSIVMKRLPVVNVDIFLQTHNIKRITQGEKVIHEIGEKNKESEIPSTDQEVPVIKNRENLSQENTKDNHAIEWPDISQVKTALLIDSDSDDNVPDKRNEQNTVQTEKENNVNNSENKTDDQSDSNNFIKDKEDRDGSSPTQLEVEDNVSKNEDNQETTSKSSDKEIAETTSKSSDKEIAETTSKSSDKEIAETTSKSSDKETTAPCEDDSEAVKSALLHESSNSTPPSPNTPQSKRRKLSETTPKSKRKCMMESMHAKKMLLTYSSSSETEDENLKKAFKDIKQALLKDGSSDEEASKKDENHSGSESDVNNKRRREQLSSDSGDDILQKVKRLKKKCKTKRRTKSGSSSPAKEEEKNGNPSQEAGDNASIDSTIDQVDGTMDEQSNSNNIKLDKMWIKNCTQQKIDEMGRSKEKAGSSQNSDAPDDKDIDGLTNLSTLNQTRRRRDSAEGSSSRRKGKMPKRGEPLIKGEQGLVEADITDDESGAESEGGVEEDLPPVSMSGLNGAGIGELAKEDLLGESDSSSSNEKDQQSEDNAKKEESSSEDQQIKLKRRKIAISSDSEAGSSRRKRDDDADVRLSDFEDSEAEEGSEPVKKSKKKKDDSDDGSQGSSSEGGKKKRRRIKQIDDSDASGSDSDNEGKNKHGRKNIRKVMGKNQLEEATKKAARQEKERLARIAERQKLYNNLAFDESGKPDEVVLDKVVLDFDPETKEPLIQVDRGLVKKLKPHQANGIKFMWDACFESVKRIKKDKGSGCILAHCMGLGKTLQVVSLTHTLLTHGELTKVERVLVVCPLSTVLNWVNEFTMWLKHAQTEYEVDVYELSRFKQNSERAYQLSQWYKHGGVCVLGYEMFRNLSADNTKKYKKKMLKTFQEALVDPGPDLVVCDEGHLLKNEKTSLSQSMNRVRTLRRIVLTGTPLQNNLKEYYCMVQFVKPNLLGKYNEYLNRFVNPITNGQYTDSTEHDIRVMKRRSHVLHKMLDGAVQRRDYGVLAPFLPPKHEYVLFITLSEVQVKLYQHYLENYSRRPLAGKSSGFLFPDFQSLQRIWTHPLVLKYNSERYEIMQQKKRDKEEEDSEGSLADFIDDDSTPEETSTDESSDDLSDLSDDSHKKSKKKKKEAKKSKAKEAAASRRRGTRANPVEMEDEEVKELDQIEGKNDNPTEWWIPLVTDEELDDVRNSHKLLLLLEILRQCEAIGDKLLVFSQSLYSLDLIEHFLGKIDEATQDGRVDEKLGGHVGSWSPGIDYFRLDGSTSCENRSIWCKNFNREDNPRARLFLISTRAGGLGINLVAANRVVIFDVSWNPSHDVQSIFRVYRFGQKKPCYIYRFLAMGTMEEKIYERQVTKQAISKRVIDEQQIDRHYAENDLAELYKFEPTPPSPRPVPLVPKDRLFAEIMKQHEDCIYKFHEHDSLLENKEEETLTEEERKAAWEDFENEKNRPPPVPFANVWPPHNGMAGLLAQQQQQLAFAALASMLRKDMPALTEDQIRGMLPLIYSSNPGMFGGYDYGLMQKLNDIYKYPQASMMNPAAMMNPVMNPVAAAGSGTAGLQYEPPWAREQQQQQQMRLQQLLQHQNMGAKYYAGGLGSRDPVAMALQQQRAREIMVGDRGLAPGLGPGLAPGLAPGRPRGRPPLQPRAPPADVVNLDSD